MICQNVGSPQPLFQICGDPEIVMELPCFYFKKEILKVLQRDVLLTHYLAVSGIIQKVMILLIHI